MNKKIKNLEDLKTIVGEWGDKMQIHKIRELENSSATVQHLLNFCGIGANPTLKSTTHLSRREEIIFNRLRVSAWCILVENRPGGNSVFAPAKSDCPWCGLTGNVAHFLEECVCLREEQKLLNYDSNEPLLSTDYKPAPFIRALVCKLCQ